MSNKFSMQPGVYGKISNLNKKNTFRGVSVPLANARLSGPLFVSGWYWMVSKCTVLALLDLWLDSQVTWRKLWMITGQMSSWAWKLRT